MPSLFDIVIAIIGAWRLAHMFNQEAGPWDIFIRLRDRLGSGVFGKAMDCIACMSVWLALLVYVPKIRYFMIIMAISGMVMFMEAIYGLLRRKPERV